MQHAINIINPKITKDKVMKHLPHVLQKLKEAITHQQNKNVTEVQQTPKVMCPLCQCTNSFTKTAEGYTVCEGFERQGCGYVLQMQHLTIPYNTYELNDDYQNNLYSTSFNFRSYLRTDNKKIKSLNIQVDRQARSLTSNSLVTSDVYKDKQRSLVFNLIDAMNTQRIITMDQSHYLKRLFTVYRSKMERIHKRDLVLCCLLHIVLHPDLLN